MPEQGETVDPDPSNENPPDETHVEPRGELPPSEPPPTKQMEPPTGELPTPPKPVCQSVRQRKPTDYLGYFGSHGFGYSAKAINRQQMQATAMVSTLMDRLINTTPRNRAGTYQLLMLTYLSEGYADCSDPIAFAAATGSGDPDTIRYHEAMRAVDWEEFGKAAGNEIQTLENLGTWNKFQEQSTQEQESSQPHLGV
jgi:hypothetical protein